MDNRSKLSPTCVDAAYLPSLMPHFKGNPLIEGLPPAMEAHEALEIFSKRPPFDVEQRNMTTMQRIQMLRTLSQCMFPMNRHVVVAAELDSLLRNGYVGREPGTAEHTIRLQNAYQLRMGGGAAAVLDEDEKQQFSMLLMGVSGMGKTRFVKRWKPTMPSVIFHAGHNLYQVPVLHIELPSNGASVAGMCNAIFSQMDKLIPGAGYLERYALKGKPSAETLIQRAASVLHRHCVGILICDEVQNLTNAGKNKETVMTELVSMSNVMGVPLMFIGTNKAERLFGLEFRQSRRAVGQGTEAWDRLRWGARKDDGSFDCEWRDFLNILWDFQWTRQPVALTEEFIQLMYDYSQGVIDIAIKLFAATQARAMHDGSETLTRELLTEVYKREFVLVHPMLDALRTDDWEALAAFDDIRPLGLEAILESVARKEASKASAAIRVKHTSPGFKDRVTVALMATGFDEKEAAQAAQIVVDEGRAQNLVQATEAGIAQLMPKRRAKRATASEASAPERDFAERPGDLRRAAYLSKRDGTTVVGQMFALGFLKPVDELFSLS